MLKKAKIYSNKSAKSLEIVDLLMKKLVEKNFDIEIGRASCRERVCLYV